MSSVALILLSLLTTGKAPETELNRREWTIDGAPREALIYVPRDARTTLSPVVFAFHGHGGTMKRAAASFHVHQLWPEAIVVYMQGLPTPGQLVDREGKLAGWQHTVGDQKDRDLHFFDAVLKSLSAEHKVDPHRIYAMGHSNGGTFTYVLWAGRSDAIAAYAPMCSADLKEIPRFKPRPALIVVGNADPLVKPEWQQFMIRALKKTNGCAAQGRTEGKELTIYPSQTGTPLATYLYDGGHAFPPEVLPVIVTFFKHHPRDASSGKHAETASGSTSSP